VNYRIGNAALREWFRCDQGLIANQIAITTIAATMTLHATGVTRFELPLRGESLAAWLNSFCMVLPLVEAGRL
jgi:hypothetical protein